jgi:hypothetical protein
MASSTHVRECSVRFRDKDGIEHEVLVFASSVMQAAALGLSHFRRADWSRDESYYNSKILIEVRESTVYRVSVIDAELWAKRNGLNDKLPEVHFPGRK